MLKYLRILVIVMGVITLVYCLVLGLQLFFFSLADFVIFGFLWGWGSG